MGKEFIASRCPIEKRPFYMRAKTIPLRGCHRKQGGMLTTREKDMTDVNVIKAIFERLLCCITVGIGMICCWSVYLFPDCLPFFVVNTECASAPAAKPQMPESIGHLADVFSYATSLRV